jgi:NADH-quinone oxidoreductase subunit N
MFSMAGVPPMVGFFGKFYVLRAAYEAGLAWLAIAGVVASVIGAYYYMRIVYFMYFGADSEPLDTQTPRRLTLILVVSTALITVGAAFSLFGLEPLAQLAAESLAN